MENTRRHYNIANILLSAAGVAVGDGIAVAEAGMSGIGSLIDLVRWQPGKPDTLVVRVERRLDTALSGTHLSEAQRVIIPQMIERTNISGRDVIACARDARALTERMIEGLTDDPAHRTPNAIDGFRQVVTPILADLLVDPEVSSALRPLHEQATAQSLAALQAGQEVTNATMQRIADLLVASFAPKDTTPDVLAALRAMGNTLPDLPAVADRIETAIAGDDREAVAQTLNQAISDARSLRRKLAEARDEADRQFRAAADTEARLIVIDAERMWKAKERIESIRRLSEATEIAADAEVVAEVKALRLRRFNLHVHLQRDLHAAQDAVEIEGMPRPDVYTYSSLISKAPDFARAEALRQEMVAAGVKPNEVTFNTLIAKAPDFARAEALRQEMVAAGVKPNEITFTTLIAKAPDFARAEALRQEMVAAGVKPNEITFNTLIAKAPDFARAEALRQEMVAAGVKPNEFTFNTLISKARTHMAAMKLWREMLRAEVRPNKQLVTSLMKSAPSVTDANKIAGDFRRAGGQMDVQLLGCLMVKTKEYKILRQILDGMIRNGPQPDRLIWQHTILNAPDRQTRLTLTRDMRAAGYEPDDRMWAQLAKLGIFGEDLG